MIKVLIEGTEGEVTGLLANSTGDGIGWYRIETNAENRGWVAGQYIETASGTNGSGFAIGSVVEVDTDNLNLRPPRQVPAPSPLLSKMAIAQS